ncbi:MAG: YIP1 family protein [Halobacteriales archaeon]
MLNLLTDPDGFFEERADDPSLVGPSLVMLTVIVVGGLASLPTLQRTTAAMPAEAGAFASLVYLFGAIGAVVGTLVAWLLYAGVFHVVSAAVYGAEGGFTDTLALAGWGFVPRIPEGVISGAISYAVFSGVTVPADPVRAARMIQQLRHDPLFTLASVLGIVFLLWSALLWTFAMRHGRDLTLRQAAVTVAVPVSVGLALDLLGLAGVI